MFKFFRRFSTKQHDDFAESLAEKIAKQYPPSLAADPSVKVSEKRLTKILEKVYDKAVQYRADNKLGVYGKARLGNTFRWKLEELGYGKQFIDVATEGLIVHLSKK
jgi:hypothetical protein